MTRFLFSRVFAVALMAGVGLASIAPDADAARRLGGGKSVGKQSDNVSKQAPAAAPAQQAAPSPQQAAPGAAGAAAGAAAPARNRWLGPLAGIAAGLGIAALLSHFGMAGAFAEAMMSFLMIGLLVMAAFFIYRMIKNRNNPAAATANGAPLGGRIEPTNMARDMATPAATPAAPFPGGIPAIGSGVAGTGVAGAAVATASAGGGTWTVPAGFDTDDFLHIAKMYFMRLQAAWDAGDERDIRTFTTPEMFAEVKLDLLNRTENSQTNVLELHAKLLGVEEQGETTLASVHLSGMIRETADGPAESFREVWNLEKPASAKASWVLAGIQQVNS
jgi:predicted lipid-binding transport protein (Tim44 family)